MFSEFILQRFSKHIGYKTGGNVGWNVDAMNNRGLWSRFEIYQTTTGTLTYALTPTLT